MAAVAAVAAAEAAVEAAVEAAERLRERSARSAFQWEEEERGRGKANPRTGGSIMRNVNLV